MTELPKGLSWLEQAKSDDPGFAAEQSAADGALRVSVLLNQAWAECESAGVERKDLAAALHLDPSRVTQVLNGDGNVRLSTLAKFLRVMGYQLEVEARPQVEGRKPIGRARSKRRRRGSTAEEGTSSVYVSMIEHQGNTSFKWSVFDESFPLDHREVTKPFLVGQLAEGSQALHIRMRSGATPGGAPDIWSETSRWGEIQ